MITERPSHIAPLTVNEIEGIARKNLPDNVYNYYACGADEERVSARNRDMFQRLYIRPRVMVDVTSVDTSTSIFNKRYPYPIAFAPSAMQKLAHPNGELDVAAAAAKLGLNMGLSSQSTTSLEDVAACMCSNAAAPDMWFQIYLTKDLKHSLQLIQRASAAGYTALVVTVDTPVLGNRINERKTPLVLPPGLHLANYSVSNSASSLRRPTYERLLLDARTAEKAKEVVEEAGTTLHSSDLTWQHTLPWLRNATSMKIILKGIMTEEDAQIAVEQGVDAIIVSNHGGRQLDSTTSTIEALPGIAQVVDGRIPVIMDGGVRSGSDVFKALALGADLILIGRPVLWGLSHDGQAGVETVANIFERELWRTMVLAGVTQISSIDRSCLGVPKRDGFGVARL